jgi:hypothetical protein
LQQKIIKLALTAKKMEALRLFAQEGKYHCCAWGHSVSPSMLSLFFMPLF